MNWNLKEALQSLAKEEQGAVYKRQGIPIALMYPNSYYVGMSNLGLHIIYKEINNRSDSYCERVFMPDKKDLAGTHKTVRHSGVRSTYGLLAG